MVKPNGGGVPQDRRPGAVKAARQGDDHRKDAILEAVLEIAGSEGFEAVSIRKVAAAAGVSHSLITYHYENKERLIAEAWFALHQRESRRRDETVGRVSGTERVLEGFRLAFEVDRELPDSLRVDFWAKTAKTAALLRHFAERRDSLRARHIEGLRASVREGKIDLQVGSDLDLVEDLLQALQYGIHVWAALEVDQNMAPERAMKLADLFVNLLAPARKQ